MSFLNANLFKSKNWNRLIESEHAICGSEGIAQTDYEQTIKKETNYK